MSAKGVVKGRKQERREEATAQKRVRETEQRESLDERRAGKRKVRCYALTRRRILLTSVSLLIAYFLFMYFSSSSDFNQKFSFNGRGKDRRKGGSGGRGRGGGGDVDWTVFTNALLRWQGTYDRLAKVVTDSWERANTVRD